jgi:molybdopterin converting factor small subunit
MEKITVKVRRLGVLPEYSGKREDTVELRADNATVEELINELVKKNGGNFRKFLMECVVSINGKLFQSSDTLGVKLANGDLVVFIPPIYGG